MSERKSQKPPKARKKKPRDPNAPKPEPRNKVPPNVDPKLKNLLAYKMPNWKEGQSGNPAGKPEGPNRSTILKCLLSIPTTKEVQKVYLDKLGIDASNSTLEEALDLTLIKKAIVDEDLKAIQEIKDTLHGKMAEVRKIGGEEGAPPIRVRRIVDDVPLDD